MSCNIQSVVSLNVIIQNQNVNIYNLFTSNIKLSRYMCMHIVVADNSFILFRKQFSSTKMYIFYQTTKKKQQQIAHQEVQISTSNKDIDLF
jgi:hypothetical protein